MKMTSILIFGLAIGLVGCTGPTKRSVLPDRGPTTMEVYEAHLGGKSTTKNASGETKEEAEPWDVVEGNRILPRYQGKGSVVASQIESIKKDFSKVHNPEIVGYVYPHLSTSNHPVPGYFTLFTLYDGEHYATNNSEGMIRQLGGGY